LLGVVLIADPVKANDAPNVVYDVTVEAPGADGDLVERIESQSDLIGEKGNPPATRAGLNARVANDRDQLTEVLRAEGYHDGRIDIRVTDEAAPLSITITVSAGERFLLRDLRLIGVGRYGADDKLIFERENLGLSRGAPARATAVVDAETRLVALLGERGYPFARLGDRRVLVDHATHRVDITLTVDIGPPARFGAVEISGLDRVEPDFVRRRIPWSRGDPYDGRVLAAFRAALVRTGLFDLVTARPADSILADGTVVIRLEVAERKPRSLGVGLSYSTAEGGQGRIFWTHRNLFGAGERLRLELEGGEVTQGGRADFRLPDAFGVDNALTFETRFAREQTDAFETLNFGAGARAERRFTPRLTGSAGVAFDYIVEEKDDTNFQLLSAPLALRFDSSDDPFDPKEGARVLLTVTPSADFAGLDVYYLKSEIEASGYLDLAAEPGQAVLAARARVGSIVGAETMRIPASRRFYAGGGGSVRGFGFQQVGPKDASGDPVGGRSVMEVGIELRLRVTETIGVVPFVDGGMVYDEDLPQFDRDLAWGAGLGLRYYTPVGPIRADIATPLNGTSSDDSFQFYISIGQAF